MAEADVIVGDVDASGADSTSDGSIAIVSVTGNVTVSDLNADGIALITNGTGEIIVDAVQAIQVNADVVEATDNVTNTPNLPIVQRADVEVTTQR